MDSSSISVLISNIWAKIQGFGIVNVVIVTALVLTLIYLLILLKKRKRATDNDIRKVKANGKNHALWLLRFYKNTPVLKRYFAKVYSRVVLFYPADDYSVNKKAANILTAGTLTGIAGLILTILISGGSIYFICAGFLVTLVMINGVTNSQLNKLEKVILVQLAEATSKIRHYYQDTRIVETSLSLALDELPYEISLHIKNIYDVVINPNMKYEVDKYVASAPNKYLITLLSICSTVKEMGDKKLSDGTSVFINDLNYLKDEINQEMIANQKNEMAFKSLTTIALAPVLAIKPIESWAKSNMEEIATYYNGIYGIVAMISIFVISFLTYNIITTLRDKDRTVEKEDTIFSKLIDNIPFVDDFLSKIIAKNYGKYRDIDKNMQSMGDYSGPRVYLMKRFTLAIGTFLMVVFVLFGSTITQKGEYISNFVNAFSESVVPSEEYRETMRYTAEEYANLCKTLGRNELPSEDDLTTAILADSDISSEAYAREIAAVVLARIDKYYNTYFKFWYLLIAIGLGVLASEVPVLMLKVKKSVIESRREEEVMQFQNLMLVLMHMDGITVLEILEWMERFSFCFKEDIAECRVNLSRGEKEALTIMKNQTTYAPFSDFVDNLISVDKVGVADAFDEIKTDREYYKEKRKNDSERNIMEKSAKARLLSYLPLGATLVLYLIAPLLMYAMNMMESMKEIFV